MNNGWNPVETLPYDRKVIIKTSNGLERIARRSRRGRPIVNRRGIPTVHCWRSDGRSGDLMAIGWREIRP